MEKFYHNKLVVGIKLDRFTEGTNTVTSATESLQLLIHNFKKGKEIKSHYHKPTRRYTEKLQECLVVKKGEISVQLYSMSGEKIDTLVLSAGEVFILLNGGWGITVNKDSEFVEIKNGPFLEDRVNI
jgi:hypothetical protein